MAKSETETRNEAAVRAGFERWAKGTGNVFELLAEDATWTITGRSVAAKTYTSRADFLDNVIKPFGARMAKPLVPVVKKLYADGDTVIAHFSAEGMARDGKPYRNEYVWILELRDEKIVAATAFFDSIEFDDYWRRVTPAA